jgi:putative RNA 2'-phosphotransferase
MSSKSDQTRASKFISLVLRHDPSAAAVTLDPSGWAEIDALLKGMSGKGYPLTRDDLLAIVRDDAKQRYAISDDGLRIRANQGHSITVELDLQERTPPAVLFHGTGHRAVETIRREGLKPMGRHHVHLSSDEVTARAVGQRHGRPVVFRIAAETMAASGIKFYLSANGVWLVEAVPPEHLAEM